MIVKPIMKTHYTFHFPNHEFKIKAIASIDNMYRDFADGIMISIECDLTNKTYMIDLSKVYMIECDENPEFKDMQPFTAKHDGIYGLTTMLTEENLK